MSEMFEDIIGAKVVIDGILVWGKMNSMQHDVRLAQVLERAYYLTSQGLQPDPKKVQAVRDTKQGIPSAIFRYVDISVKVYPESLPSSITTENLITRERHEMGVGTMSTKKVSRAETACYYCSRAKIFQARQTHQIISRRHHQRVECCPDSR